MASKAQLFACILQARQATHDYGGMDLRGHRDLDLATTLALWRAREATSVAMDALRPYLTTEEVDAAYALAWPASAEEERLRAERDSARRWAVHLEAELAQLEEASRLALAEQL